MLRRANSLTLVVLALALTVGACSSTGGPRKYEFDLPSGDNPAMARIGDIEHATEGCDGCTKCSRDACASYNLEAGLIIDKIREVDYDAIKYYRRALAADPDNCDAMLLLASALGRLTRDDQALTEAADLMSRTDGCGEGAVVSFHRAIGNVFSGDSERVAKGRSQLDAMTSARFGDSGITQDDIHNVLLYSYLADSSFAEASRRMNEAEGVVLSPKLQSLMYIGQGRAADLAKIELADRTSVAKFLDESLEEYRPQPAIERLVSEARSRLGVVEAVPWSDLERRWKENGESPWQTEIQKVIVTDEYGRLTKALATRAEALASVDSLLARLQKAEIQLIKDEIAKAFGGASVGARGFSDYVRAHNALGRSMEDLTAALRQIVSLNYVADFFPDKHWLEQEAQVIADFESKRGNPAEEDLVVEVLQGFARAKAAALRPGDFFRPFQVEMDQLSARASTVTDNVRTIAELQD